MHAANQQGGLELPMPGSVFALLQFSHDSSEKAATSSMTLRISKYKTKVIINNNTTYICGQSFSFLFTLD